MFVCKKVIVWLFLVTGGLDLLAGEEAARSRKTEVARADLQSGNAVVIGELGLPLGTPVEVEGVLLPPKKSPYVTFPVEIQLAVDTIDGKKLKSPKEFSFRVENPVESRMGNTELELGKVFDFLVEQHEMSREQANRYFGDYAKVRRKILVYESAHFFGRPANVPGRHPTYAEPPFGFATFLVVVTPKPQ